MVTLLGFFFILVNVGLLEIFIPDLVGPVGCHQATTLALVMGGVAKRLWR